MKNFFKKYGELKKRELSANFRRMRNMKMCYLFLLPFAVLFIAFYILPMFTSIFYSFTNFNMLEKPEFIGFRNYINLFLKDEVNQTAIKNTFIIAVITGPAGYIISFLIAWLINELPKWMRTIAVVIFYSPSIAGNVYVIFSIIFRGDMYGITNSILMKLNIIDTPVLWLTDPRYIMTICIIVILWMSLGQGFLSFVAGLQGIDKSQYEAGYIDGIRNRWQELWFITLPNMKPMLLFGAVMSITTAFGVCDVTMNLAGYPSTDYAARTVVTHLFDYGYTRFEMGYASAIATMLFLVMILCKKAVMALLNRVGR
jgi:multiple sugar transport system permease protein